jgi:hypothetical protein
LLNCSVHRGEAESAAKVRLTYRYVPVSSMMKMGSVVSAFVLGSRFDTMVVRPVTSTHRIAQDALGNKARRAVLP